MQFSGEEKMIFDRWQNLHLMEKYAGQDIPTKQADIARKLLHHTTWAHASEVVSWDTYENFFFDYAMKYAAIMDTANGEAGRSYYTDSVFSRPNIKNNLDRGWKTSLSLTNIKKKAHLYDNLPILRYLDDDKDNESASIQHVRCSEETSKSLYFGKQNLSNNCEKSNITISPQLSVNTFQTPYQNNDKKRSFNEVESNNITKILPDFVTAHQQLSINNHKKNKVDNEDSTLSSFSMMKNKKSLGTRRGLNSKFVLPLSKPQKESFVQIESPSMIDSSPSDETLKHIEPKMIELIKSEIMDHGPPVTWDDIAGLEFAKKAIKEIVVWPMLRPDIFTGLRGPPKGLLLFGPPGTGKTLIGKCIACQSGSTFFSISASSLTSKWVGEAEKMVRALFAVARVYQPAVIFMDEIDSLLSQRSDGENEASRRIKTEFLVQLDGAGTSSEERILLVGATNRPQEIDEAARRRFVKRLYIPLPEEEARSQIICNLMKKQKHYLLNEDYTHIVQASEGYSGADMTNLCREAALGPIRCLSYSQIENISVDDVRSILRQDFDEALKQVKSSVSSKDLNVYLDWNQQFGSWPML